ncbi:MAG: hypothetical protein HY692_03735, partial [Cyanobacteria bacterium NC_groundwater_1444_Ag_S-0.65um_54_12]|nr:hypothetical protein [Cyanobacteria bacterium NC_groundwater_1444_Ag_S-0.65um_54_12]
MKIKALYSRRTIWGATAATMPIALVVAVGCFGPPSGTSPSAAPAATATPKGTSPTPTPGTAASPTASPSILTSATHEYYAQSDGNCLKCHTDQKPGGLGNNVPFMPIMPNPATHTGRTEATCLVCHPKAPSKTPPIVKLTVARAGSAPIIDGTGSDAVWSSATEASIPVSGGLHASAGTVKLKALHDGTNVYFMATWADPTESIDRGPYVKKAAGNWEAIPFYPDSYEDKIAFIWNNPDKPTANFSTQGCAVMCHAVTAYGRPLKYTNTESEIADMWHAKIVRHVLPAGINQMDDQNVIRPIDINEASPSTVATAEDGGRRGDKQTTSSGDKIANKLVNNLLPQWMPAAAPFTVPPGYMQATQSFDDTKYNVGDKVASIVAKKLTEGRGDIEARTVYN